MNPGNTLPEIKSPIVLMPLLNSGITMLVKNIKKEYTNYAWNMYRNILQRLMTLLIISEIKIHFLATNESPF